MMFSNTTSKAMARVASYLPLIGKGKTTDDEKIYRAASTDYRLVYDQSGEVFLCFGACIRLDRQDVDFSYFEECGRTGNTTVTVHGSGALEFAKEEGCDPFVFADHPDSDSFSFVSPPTIVLEMV